VDFEFATAGRIVFGRGALKQAGPIAARLGRRALVVTGRSSERAERLLESLAGQGLHFALWRVTGEPSVDSVSRGAEMAREAGCDVTIGFGGGSAVDAAKAIAALVANPGEPLDYLEVIGKGRPLADPPLPFIAIPTTSGTGAEATRNAVLASPEQGVKASLRSPLMLPRVAIVDPELALTVPPDVTAATGMDALAQLVEAFVSVRANPLTDSLCREGMALCARSLKKAYQDGLDISAREEMALAALLSGMALSNAGLGAVHGFAAVLGGLTKAPHGALCAQLFPAVLAVNIAALEKREPNGHALARYGLAAKVLTGAREARPAGVAEWAEELARALSIPRLAECGLTRSEFPSVCERAERASSMQGNPLKLTREEMREILERAF
jgi:alcohol dehydrogenase class IV